MPRSRGPTVREQKWAALADPVAMVDKLTRMPDAKQSERKLRLFAVAACRLIWDRLPVKVCRPAVEVAELHADGLAALEELRDANDPAHEYWRESWEPVTSVSRCASFAAFAASDAPSPLPIANAGFAARGTAMSVPQAFGRKPDRAAATGTLILLLRDIFGPTPFRSVGLSAACRTETVLGLAEAIYADKAFDRLPVLADALEEAGCTDAEILAHCRYNGPHARGCWVVDLILEKK